MRARLAIVLVALAGCGRIVGIHDFVPADGGTGVDSAAFDSHAGAIDTNRSETVRPLDVAADYALDVPMSSDVAVPVDTGIDTGVDTSIDGARDAVADTRDTGPDGKACPAPSWQMATASILSSAGRGACGYDPATLPTFVAAIDEKGFDEARGCGICLRLVTGRTDVITRYVDVLVVDRAGGSSSSTRQLNIAPEAMDALTGSDTQSISLNFAVVPCPTTLVGPTIRMNEKQGSSPQQLSLQIRDQALPLAGAEVWFGNTWSPMTFTSYNYWVFNSVGIAPPYSFRLTNSLGDAITVNDIALTSTVTSDGPLVDTGVQFPSCLP